MLQLMKADHCDVRKAAPRWGRWLYRIAMIGVFLILSGCGLASILSNGFEMAPAFFLLWGVLLLMALTENVWALTGCCGMNILAALYIGGRIWSLPKHDYDLRDVLYVSLFALLAVMLALLGVLPLRRKLKSLR